MLCLLPSRQCCLHRYQQFFMNQLLEISLACELVSSFEMVFNKLSNFMLQIHLSLSATISSKELTINVDDDNGDMDDDTDVGKNCKEISLTAVPVMDADKSFSDPKGRRESYRWKRKFHIINHSMADSAWQMPTVKKVYCSSGRNECLDSRHLLTDRTWHNSLTDWLSIWPFTIVIRIHSLNGTPPGGIMRIPQCYHFQISILWAFAEALC